MGGLQAGVLDPERFVPTAREYPRLRRPKTRMEEEIICNRWKDLADECR